MSVRVRVDGMMVVAAVAIGGAVYLYSKREKLAKKVNPASNENLLYRDVLGGGTGGTFDSVANKTIGLFSISPVGRLISSDAAIAYGEKLWGLDK